MPISIICGLIVSILIKISFKLSFIKIDPYYLERKGLGYYLYMFLDGVAFGFTVTLIGSLFKPIKKTYILYYIIFLLYLIARLILILYVPIQIELIDFYPLFLMIGSIFAGGFYKENYI